MVCMNQLLAEPFVEPGHLYVFDAGIVSFDYLSKILTGDSHLLCNLASKVNFTIFTQRKLTAADRTAGVLSDRVGMLSGSNAHTPPNATLREVIVEYTDRTGGVKQLRLLTDLLDLSAKDVARLYSKRWQIELFFRWLKVSANFIHLCSHSRNGISLSFHVAVIAAMLMVLRTQRPLSLYSYNLLSFVASGQAHLQDILPILENRERQRKLERDRLARKRAAQKSV